MTAEWRIPGWSRLVIGACLLVLVLQGFTRRSASKTPTFDEPAHIAAGFSYLKTGDFRINLQHPPLLKEIACAAAGADRHPLAGRTDAEWTRMTRRGRIRSCNGTLGLQVIYTNDYEKVMFWSRLPFLGLALLLGCLIYGLGPPDRRRDGRAGGARPLRSRSDYRGPWPRS